MSLFTQRIEEPTLQRILHYQRGVETIFKHLAINEVNIINAFEEFFESLPSSDYILSKAHVIDANGMAIEVITFRPVTILPDYQKQGLAGN